MEPCQDVIFYSPCLTTFLDQEADLSFISSELYTTDFRDFPPAQAKTPDGPLQNPVRKGIVTWSTLDILDLTPAYSRKLIQPVEIYPEVDHWLMDFTTTS